MTERFYVDLAANLQTRVLRSLGFRYNEQKRRVIKKEKKRDSRR